MYAENQLFGIEHAEKIESMISVVSVNIIDLMCILNQSITICQDNKATSPRTEPISTTQGWSSVNAIHIFLQLKG
jgi:hypothetical protein